MQLTPGMAEGAGEIGYAGGVVKCRPCHVRVWEPECRAHEAQHYDPDVVVVHKPGQDGPILYYG